MDTQKQTFSRLLHIAPACGKITAAREKALCPICRRGVVAYLLPDTTATNLPVKCKRCGAELVVNISQVPVP
nr:MAG TPA: cysteine-rich protein [Caudoviricetes sp.]